MDVSEKPRFAKLQGPLKRDVELTGVHGLIPGLDFFGDGTIDDICLGGLSNHTPYTFGVISLSWSVFLS